MSKSLNKQEGNFYGLFSPSKFTRNLFLIFSILLVSFSSKAQVLLAGTSFDPSAGNEGRSYIGVNEITQYGLQPGSISVSPPLTTSANPNVFNGTYQYAVTNKPSNLDKVRYDSTKALDYQMVFSPSTTAQVNMLQYNLYGVSPGTPVSVTVDYCSVVNPAYNTSLCGPGERISLRGVVNPDGSNLNFGQESPQLEMGKCSTFTFTQATSSSNAVGADGNVVVRLNTMNPGQFKAISITKIEIRGTPKPEVISQGGIDVCAGEQINVQTKQLYNGTYQWQVNTGSGWSNVTGGTQSALLYESGSTPNINYQFRVLITPTTGGAAITSDPVSVKAITCCTQGTPPVAASRQTIYYDNFGRIDLNDKTGKTYIVWDYTDPLNPKEVSKSTATPFRWPINPAPLNATFQPTGPLVDGEYAVAGYLTTYNALNGYNGAMLQWAGNVTGKTAAPSISYDHSGNIDGAALFLNCPPNTGGQPLYTRTISNLCFGKQLFFECWIAVFTNSSQGAYNGVNVKVRLTDGGDAANVIETTATANREASGGGIWVKVSGQINLVGTSLKMEIINNQNVSVDGNDLVVDDIKIMACAPPPLDLFFDLATLAKTKEICTNAADLFTKPTDLLKKYYNNSPTYLYQWTKTPLVNSSWKNLGAPQTGESYPIADPKTAFAVNDGDKVYFRVIAATPAIYTAKNNFQGAGNEANINDPCKNYSVSAAIEATVVCPKCNPPATVAITSTSPITGTGAAKTITVCDGTGTLATLKGAFTSTTGSTNQYGPYKYSWYKKKATPAYTAVPIADKTLGTADAGTWVLRVEDYNGTSPSSNCYREDSVKFVITPAPIAPTATNPTYCQGATASPVTATAATGNTLTWYDAATLGTVLTTPASLTPSTATAGLAVVKYWVSQKTSAASGGCEGPRLEVDVNVTAKPATLTPTAPANFCEGTTPTVWSATAGTGNSLLWYTAATGGTGATTVPIIPNTPAGVKSVWVSQITPVASGGCESDRAEIKVTVTAKPAALTPTAPANFCEDGTATTWSATAAGTNTLLWYTAATGGVGTATAPAIPNTPSGVKSVWVTQKTDAASGGCESDRAKIDVTVKKKITGNEISADQQICLGDAVAALGQKAGVTIAGDLASPAYKWKSSTTAGGPYTDVTPAATGASFTPTGLTQTTYLIREALGEGGLCPSIPSNEVKITVDQPITGNTITPATQTICSGNSPTVTGAAITNGTYVWEQATTSGGTYTAITGATTQDLPAVSLTNTNAGTTISYFFRRKATVGKCSNTSLPVEVKVSGGMTAGTIAQPHSICLGEVPKALTSTAAATGGTVSPIEYEWFSSPNGSNGWVSLGARSAANTQYTPTATPTADIYYKRKAYAGSGVCDTASTTAIKVTVVTPPVATILTPVNVVSPNNGNYTFNDAILNISATPVTTGYTGAWTLSPKGTLGFVASSATNTVTGMNYDDQSTLIWEVKVAGDVCPSAKATINIERKNITVASVKNDSLCVTGLPYTLQGNGLITGETSQWRYLPSLSSGTATTSAGADSKQLIITGATIPANAGKAELFFEYTVNSPLAGKPSLDTARIIVYEQTQVASTTGPINTCASFVQLTGNQPTQATASGVWSIVNGQGSLLAPSVYNTNLEKLDNIGVTNLTWTISNHLCPSTSAPLVVDQKGKSTDAVFTITGGSYAALDITNKTDIALCTGTAYTLNSIGPKAGETAAWTSTSTPSITGSTTSVSFTPSVEGAADAKWTITPSIAGCSPTVATAAFKIGGIPVLDPTTGPDPVCENTPHAYTANLATTAGINNLPILSYAWTDVAGTPTTTGKATIQGAATGATANFLFSSTKTTGTTDQATVSVKATNACGTSTAADKLVTIDLIPREEPTSITGLNEICGSKTLQYKGYSVPASTISPISYVWKLGTSAEFVTTQPSTILNTSDIIAQAPSVVLSVRLRNACGDGDTVSKTIKVINPEQVNAQLTGKNPICLPTESVQYTGSTTNGGAGATFTFSIERGGAVIGTPQGPLLTKTFDVVPGDVRDGDVIKLNVIGDTATGCFVGNGGNASLVVDGYEAPDTNFTASDDSICTGATINICPTGIAGKNNGTFELYRDASLVATGTSCYAVTTPAQSGVYTLKVSNGVCATLTSLPKRAIVYQTPTVQFVPDDITMELLDVQTVRLVAVPSTLPLRYVTWNSKDLLGDFAPDSLSANFTPPTEGGDFFYTINIATGEGSVYCPASNTVHIKALPAVRVPNAFSPNTDGKNDTWQIDGIDTYPNAKVSVYNRWGNRMFEASPYGRQNEWDGTTHGAPLASGTYYYVIDLKENTVKQSRILTGSLTIVR